MTERLKITLETLKQSRNEAAVRALAVGLERKAGTIFEGSLDALVARRGKASHTTALRVLHTLEPEQYTLLEAGRGRMSTALRDALLGDDGQLFHNACRFIDDFSEYDLLPTLLVVAEDGDSQHREAALKLTKELTDRLTELVCGPREAGGTDPEVLRFRMIEQFEASVSRFVHHKQAGIVEAFVSIALPSSWRLREILNSPHHVCHKTVINTLMYSESISVIRLLFGFLGSADAPTSVLKVIGHRGDDEFVSRFAALVREGLRPYAQRNLKKIKSFGWLEGDSDTVASLPEERKIDSVVLVQHSGMPEVKQIRHFKDLLISGGPAARVEACRAITQFDSQAADSVLKLLLDDYQPEVQAIAVAEARSRGATGMLPKLLKLLDSPHAVVREAAKESLSEFTFAKFAAQFDSMSIEMRESTSRVVRKVDGNLVAELLEEMRSPRVAARLRAITMAPLLSSDGAVIEGLLDLLEDREHLVRIAAADALQHYDDPRVPDALRAALHDKNRSVQVTAGNSLDEVEARRAGRTEVSP